MQINSPKPIPFIERNKRLNKRFVKFESLIKELQSLEFHNDNIVEINTILDKVNAFHESERDFRKQLKSAQNDILKLLETKLNIVPSNHYRDKYMAIGIALGIAFGSAFGAASRNMGFTGLWLPIGLAIGLAYGTKLDKKAAEENRQLKFEVN